jgi:hypothetical protein
MAPFHELKISSKINHLNEGEHFESVVVDRRRILKGIQQDVTLWIGFLSFRIVISICSCEHSNSTL